MQEQDQPPEAQRWPLPRDAPGGETDEEMQDVEDAGAASIDQEMSPASGADAPEGPVPVDPQLARVAEVGPALPAGRISA